LPQEDFFIPACFEEGSSFGDGLCFFLLWGGFFPLLRYEVTSGFPSFLSVLPFSSVLRRPRLVFLFFSRGEPKFPLFLLSPFGGWAGRRWEGGVRPYFSCVFLLFLLEGCGDGGGGLRFGEKKWPTPPYLGGRRKEGGLPPERYVASLFPFPYTSFAVRLDQVLHPPSFFFPSPLRERGRDVIAFFPFDQIPSPPSDKLFFLFFFFCVEGEEEEHYHFFLRSLSGCGGQNEKHFFFPPFFLSLG